MSCSIAVRNLTQAPISIKRVEQFEDPNTLQSNSGGYILGPRNTTSAAPSAPELGEHAESFQHQVLDVTLAPFESYTLGQTVSKESDSDGAPRAIPALRLTIESLTGDRHRIDIHPSYTQKSSNIFTPLSAGPSKGYTALFHPTRPTAHLTIHTHHLPDYQTWMSTIPDTLPLSALSIPGTHNSHTYYRALPSVRCQSVDIATQLSHGVRFLDIRLQPAHATDVSKKDLQLVHGAFPISLTGPKYFAPILQTCYDFLAQHPSETILMSLKREGIGGATDHHLAHLLTQHYISHAREKWYTDTTIPSFGAVRGKIVLIRRFQAPEPLGLDATSWPHNATHALFPPQNPNFCIQDFCDVAVPTTIPEKIQYVNEHLGRAASITYQLGHRQFNKNDISDGVRVTAPIHLNFLSASNFWKRACWPENIAKVVNKGMEEWMCVGHGLEDAPAEEREPGRVVDNDGDYAGIARVRMKARGDGGTGVVVMDFVGEGGDWDLVGLVVGMNMGVLAS
jgi:1-phosphatidylinositol phosphodiesterase